MESSSSSELEEGELPQEPPPQVGRTWQGTRHRQGLLYVQLIAEEGRAREEQGASWLALRNRNSDVNALIMKSFEVFCPRLLSRLLQGVT